MDIEDFEVPNPWISIKAIRNAATIKSSLKTSFHRKIVSSPPETPSNLILKKEVKLNSPSLYSINVHTRYNTASIDSFAPNNEAEGLNIEKKYQNVIFRLNSEIMILSNQLTQANGLVSQLNNRIAENNKKHALHIQALQERHEQKIKRIKQDMELFLKEIQAKTALTENFDKKNEISRLKERHQEEILEIKKICKDELDFKDHECKEQMSLLKDRSFQIIKSLKQIFIEEVECLEQKYKEKIQKVRSLCRASKRYSALSNEDDHSTIIEADNEIGDFDEDSFDHFANSLNLVSKVNDCLNWDTKEYPGLESLLCFAKS